MRFWAGISRGECMNNNDFNYQNDNMNHTAEHRDYSTAYTTPEGANGVRYGGTRSSRCRARAGSGFIVAMVVLLCIAVGFGGGIVGTYMMSVLSDEPDSVDVERGEDGTQTKFPDSAADTLIANDPAVSESDRNPTPELDKKDSLGTVTYSGSAGNAAYNTLAEAIDRVDETVVEISTEVLVSGGWLGNYISSGAGSGVVISSDGYIVTNDHVISGASSITVRMNDGVTTYPAVVVGSDAASDIAVIWVDTGDVALQAAELGCSADLIVGESVFAIGNPLGSLGGTVTNGIISATARNISINGSKMTLLQTNAAVNPGNSGGGLFNMAGQLIGVVNAKCSEDDVEGLGFAIPVDTAYDVIRQLNEYGDVRGGVDAGLSLYDANIMVARRYFNSDYEGVYVLESKFCKDLYYGDLLYSIEGIRVESGEDVEAVLSTYSVGDTVTLLVIRKGQQREVDLTLREYVPSGVGVRFPQ